MKKSFKICQRIVFIIFLLLNLNAIGQGFKNNKTNICIDGTVLFTDTTAIPSGATIKDRSWNFGNGKPVTISYTDTVSYTFDTKGTFNVTLTITYTSGAPLVIPGITPILVSSKLSNVTLSVDKKITCPGIPINFTGTYTAGSYPTVSSYDLFLGDNTPATTLSGSSLRAYTQLGSFTAKYVVKDGGGCSDSAAIKVDIIPSPKPKFYTETPSCRDSISIYINDTKFKDSFVSWRWTIFDKNNSNTLLSKNGSHTWKNPKLDSNWIVLQGVNQYQCSGTSDTLKVVVDTTPILVITPSIDTTICYGESINYIIKGAASIFFDNLIWGSKVSGDTLYNLAPKNSMTYTVYGKSPNCPKKGTDIKISVVQPILTKIKFEPDTILKGSLSNVKLSINAIYDSIRWTPIDGLLCTTCDTTGASPIVTTMYKAKVYYSLAQYVCSTETSAELAVINQCIPSNFAIPTGFTPNGDSKNDIFFLKGFSFKDVKTINIYSRWGNLVYTEKDVPANDERYGWNGKELNIGEDMPSGVYLYNIQATCSNGQTLNFQGEITLLR